MCLAGTPDRPGRPFWRVSMLPRHHNDPFDRLLIAQARARSLPIVTGDPAFADYDVTVIWDRA